MGIRERRQEWDRSAGSLPECPEWPELGGIQNQELRVQSRPLMGLWDSAMLAAIATSQECSFVGIRSEGLEPGTRTL